MKISIIKLLDSSSNDTKTYSASSFDEVYYYGTEDITSFQSTDIINTTRNYIKPILLHVIMYCYPNKIGKKDTVNENEQVLIYKWLLKSSNTMLKEKKGCTPEKLSVIMTKSRAGNMIHKLQTEHRYGSLNFNYQAVNHIQYLFLRRWNWLIGEKLIKGDKSISYDELSEMLMAVKNDVLSSVELRGFKLQNL